MEPRLIAFLFVVLTLINANPSKIDQLRQSVTPEDQRSFIKVNVLLGTAPRVVAAQLETAAPDSHIGERKYIDSTMILRKEGEEMLVINLN